MNLNLNCIFDVLPWWMQRTDHISMKNSYISVVLLTPFCVTSATAAASHAGGFHSGFKQYSKKGGDSPLSGLRQRTITFIALGWLEILGYFLVRGAHGNSINASSSKSSFATTQYFLLSMSY